MTGAIHIDDLACPTFPPEARPIIDGMAAIADYCPLDTDVPHQRASADTGLTDFGLPDYRERMAVLLQAFDELPGLTPGYQFLRLMLQVLQHQPGGNRRWVLQSPQHLEQFAILANVFPDATFIITHRDPVVVSVSMATMMTYVMRMSVDRVDVPAVANYWIDRIDEMLSACVRDRHLLPADRSIDVRFDEFMTDNLAMVHRVWDVAGYRPTAESIQAVEAYQAGHTRGRMGSIDYRAEDLGLDKAELRRRFAPYVDRFVAV